MTDELDSRRVRNAKTAPEGPRFADLMPSFILTLSERDLSPRTLELYERTGSQFAKTISARVPRSVRFRQQGLSTRQRSARRSETAAPCTADEAPAPGARD
jgi:hypothetical protein